MHQRLEIFDSIIRNLPRESMVDLGAADCWMSLHAHALGFPVTAIDARTVRLPKEPLPFSFIKQDVRDVDLSPYKIVLILGLLYHLPLDDQIVLLRKCRGKTVIVDTHCANRRDRAIGQYDGTDFVEIEDPRSAFGNAVSFWHTEPSLRRLFANMGFTAHKVLPEHAPNRAFWVLKSKPSEGTQRRP